MFFLGFVFIFVAIILTMYFYNIKNELDEKHDRANCGLNFEIIRDKLETYKKKNGHYPVADNSAALMMKLNLKESDFHKLKKSRTFIDSIDYHFANRNNLQKYFILWDKNNKHGNYSHVIWNDGTVDLIQNE